jgi:peptidoglycan/xylan/chitin deacetylase (PgdA/CDA1 family)
MTWD